MSTQQNNIDSLAQFNIFRNSLMAHCKQRRKQFKKEFDLAGPFLPEDFLQKIVLTPQKTKQNLPETLLDVIAPPYKLVFLSSRFKTNEKKHTRHTTSLFNDNGIYYFFDSHYSPKIQIFTNNQKSELINTIFASSMHIKGKPCLLGFIVFGLDGEEAWYPSRKELLEQTTIIKTKQLNVTNLAHTGNYTALHLATEIDSLESVKYYIDRQVPVNAQDIFGHTALHIAAQRGNLAIIQVLKKKFANVNIKSKEEGSSPLHIAAYNGHAEAVKEILKESKCKIDEADNHGNTALHTAAKKGHVEVLKILLAFGANTEIKNSENLTALDTLKTGAKAVLQFHRITPEHILWLKNAIEKCKPILSLNEKFSELVSIVHSTETKKIFNQDNMNSAIFYKAMVILKEMLQEKIASLKSGFKLVKPKPKNDIVCKTIYSMLHEMNKSARIPLDLPKL